MSNNFKICFSGTIEPFEKSFVGKFLSCHSSKCTWIVPI